MKKMIALSIAVLMLLTACAVAPDTSPDGSAPSLEADISAPEPTPDPSVDILPEEEWEPRVYEINARLREDMPEYRFVAAGISRGTYEWNTGFILGLEGYDENEASILSADFSYVDDGRTYGNYAYNNMMDTMGLHVVDVNFDSYKDVIILKDFGGAHSNSWYDCWLWDAETLSFVYSESFAAICNPALDPEKECIYSYGGSGVWSAREILRVINGEFIVTNRLEYGYSVANLPGYRFIETQLIGETSEPVRDVTIQTEDYQAAIDAAGYVSDDLWQMEHPRWYGLGGHHADQWLGG